MKSIQLLRLRLILFGLFFINVFSFQGCKKDDENDEICDTCRPDCDTCMVVYKPNIYLYPTTNTQLEVNLSFPLGGEIITSIPNYGNGWIVNVDTNGIINGQYGFLFYESTQPDIWQIGRGWVIPQKDLRSFFVSNLEAYGFKGREITDFTDYWVPRLNFNKYYLIYPQDIEIINKVIQLNISVKPANVLRLYYLIIGTNTYLSKIIEPQINTNFVRKGFYVTEWGVLLK